MIDTESRDGWWWVPGRHDQPQFGRLSAALTEPWKLSIFGGLNDDDAASNEGIRLADEMATAPVIHGLLVAGSPDPRYVTLLDCRQQAAQRTFGRFHESTETWTFDEIITGYDHVAPEEAVIAFRIRLSNLLEWSGRRPPRIDRSADQAGATVESQQIGRARLPDAAVSLVLDHSAIASGGAVTLRHDAMFEITPDLAVPFRSAMTDYVLPLRSMLSFLTLGHVDVTSVTGKLDGPHDERLGMSFSYRTRLQRPFEEPKPPRHHEMLASWPDIAELEVQGLVAGWFELRRSVEKTMSYLVLPHHAPYLYTDDHLMTAFVALEAYHKARIDGSALDPDEFQRRVDAVVASAPRELREWARVKLGDRNQKGMTKQLREVIDRSGPTGEAIVAACPQFVKLAIASRNTVAHPGTSDREPGATYLAISYGLRWVLRHCLLVDLGISEGRAAELIDASKPFHDELELIQRWTAHG